MASTISTTTAVVPYHVRESIRKVDENTWLLGGKALITRSSSSTKSPKGSGHWDDDDNFVYNISDVQQQEERITELWSQSKVLDPNHSSPFKLVYDAGDCHVVWKIGNAYLKVNIIDRPGVTREHVTIAAVKDTMSPTFDIPRVIYHGQWDGRYYLIISSLPGKTLVEAWPEMDEMTKCYYVDRVVEICNELATYQADYIGGVDKGQLGDQHPAKFRIGEETEIDSSHEALLEACAELGMDCSTFVFNHCDLGPGNLIIGPDGYLGIVDWESVGYVPKEWIRTKVRVSGGLNLDSDLIERKDRGEWRVRVQQRMEREGYHDRAVDWATQRNWDIELIK